MARSLIGGLIATGMSNKGISVSEPKADLREELNKDFGVHTSEENASAAKEAVCGCGPGSGSGAGSNDDDQRTLFLGGGSANCE